MVDIVLSVLIDDICHRKVGVTGGYYMSNTIISIDPDKRNEIEMTYGNKFNNRFLNRNTDFNEIRYNDVYQRLKNQFNIMNIFEELNYNKFIIAGGAVVSSIHNEVASDLDVFFYNCTKDELYNTINTICKMCINNPFINERDILIYEIFLKRSNNVITINAGDQKIQFVLRTYKNISEIIHGSDISPCCMAINNKYLYMTPLAKFSITYKLILLDTTRRNKDFEDRLFKYMKRGFKLLAIFAKNYNSFSRELYKRMIKSKCNRLVYATSYEHILDPLVLNDPVTYMEVNIVNDILKAGKLDYLNVRYNFPSTRFFIPDWRDQNHAMIEYKDKYIPTFFHLFIQSTDIANIMNDIESVSFKVDNAITRLENHPDEREIVLTIAHIIEILDQFSIINDGYEYIFQMNKNEILRLLHLYKELHGDCNTSIIDRILLKTHCYNNLDTMISTLVKEVISPTTPRPNYYISKQNSNDLNTLYAEGTTLEDFNETLGRLSQQAMLFSENELKEYEKSYKAFDVTLIKNIFGTDEDILRIVCTALIYRIYNNNMINLIVSIMKQRINEYNSIIRKRWEIITKNPGNLLTSSTHPIYERPEEYYKDSFVDIIPKEHYLFYYLSTDRSLKSDCIRKIIRGIGFKKFMSNMYNTEIIKQYTDIIYNEYLNKERLENQEKNISANPAIYQQEIR